MDQIGLNLSYPLIQKLIWAGGLLIALLVLTLIVLRIIRRAIKEESRRNQVARWIKYGVLFLYLILSVPIWLPQSQFDTLLSIVLEPVSKKIIRSALSFIPVYIALYFSRRLINSMNLTIQKKHQYRKNATYVTAALYILILLTIWAGSTKQWATVLSVIGAGVALALHEVLLNIAGWSYIVIRHPYRTGDRIELDGLRGDVIDIRLFQTTLLEVGNWVEGDQSTGRLVHVPHGQIFRKPLFNYTEGFEYLWNEIPLLFTFESNWKKAKDQFLIFGEEESRELQGYVEKKIDRMARDYLIYYRNLSPIVYSSIKDSGIQLTLRYLTEAKKRRGGVNTISQKMLDYVASQPDIDFAYPTYRIYKQGEQNSNSPEQIST